jgi:hypothetical protein
MSSLLAQISPVYFLRSIASIQSDIWSVGKPSILLDNHVFRRQRSHLSHEAALLHRALCSEVNSRFLDLNLLQTHPVRAHVAV